MERTDIMRIVVTAAAIIFATFVLIVFTGVYTDIAAWWEQNWVFASIDLFFAGYCLLACIFHEDEVEEDEVY